MPYSATDHIREFEGHLPQLGSGVFIDPSAVVSGDVALGDDTSVWANAVIRADMHSIRIGERTSIQDGSVCHITHAGPFNPEGYALTIGDDVTVAHGVMLHGCTIGSEVLIGIGSTVMDGAVIEDRVVLGANSLVPPGKTLEGGWLYTGSPARPIRELRERELKFFTYSSANYARLKDRHIAELG